MDVFRPEDQKASSLDKPNLFHQPNSSNSSIPTSNTDTEQTSSTQREDPFFRVRIINIDHVFEQRSNLDRAQSAFSKEGIGFEKVPVIRIFGATPLGQRVCLHVHDVFPYCYIEYKESLEPKHVLSYISKFGRQLNRACLVAMNVRDLEKLGHEDFVVAIHLCKATPFYGYHLGWKYFLKISFRDPKRNSMLAKVLESGNLMNGTKFQPYELHVRYILQFFLDYNLYGCDYIDLRKALFREHLPDPEENPFRTSVTQKPSDLKNKFWDSSVVPPDSEYMNNDSVRKISFCQLEVDAHASWIENRKYLSSRSHQHLDIYEKDSLKKNEKLVPSLIDLWIKFGTPQSRDSKDSMSLNPSLTQRPDSQKGKKRTPESTNRIFKRGEQHPPGGIDSYNEERFEERLKADLARLENKGLDPKNLEQDFFLKRSARNPGAAEYDKWICTTFDSVPLFHSKFQKEEMEMAKEKGECQIPEIPLKHCQTSSMRTPKRNEQEVNNNPFTPDRVDFVASQRSSGQLSQNRRSQSETSSGSSNHENLKTPTRAGLSQRPLLSQRTTIPHPDEQVLADGDVDMDTDPEAEFDEVFDETFFASDAFLSQLSKKERNYRNSEDQDPEEEETEKQVDDVEEGELGSVCSDQEEVEQERNDIEIDIKLATQTQRSGFQKSIGREDSEGQSEEDEEDDLEFEDGMEHEADGMALEDEIKLLIEEQNVRKSRGTSNSVSSFVVSPSRKRSRASSPHGSDVKAIKVQNESRFGSNSPSSHSHETPQKSQNHFLPSPFHTPSPSSRASRKIKPIPSSVAAISSSASSEEHKAEASTLPSSSPPLPLPSKVPLTSTLKKSGLSSIAKKVRSTGARVRFPSSEKSPPSSPIQIGSSGEKVRSSDESDKTVQYSSSREKDPSLVCSSKRSPQANSQTPRRFQYAKPPPTINEVSQSFFKSRMHSKLYQSPFYSNPKDIPTHKFVYADREFDLGSKTLIDLEPFDPMRVLIRQNKKARIEARESNNFQTPISCKSWQISKPPPSRREIEIWRRKDRAEVKERVARRRHLLASQVAKKSQKLSFDFKLSQRDPAAAIDREKQHMTILALEVFVAKSSHLLPDPVKDPISSIFWSFQNEDEDTATGDRFRTGMIILEKDIPIGADEKTGEEIRQTPNLKKLNFHNAEVEVVDSELDMFNSIITVVRALDPEILAGWEIHNGSWGYLFERAQQEFAYDIVAEIGRVKTGNTGKNGGKGDTWGYTKTSMFRVTGRHILNLWRLMRGELNLNQYSMENVAYELLRTRIPKFSHQTLTEWFSSSSSTAVARALDYHLRRVQMVLDIIEKSELVFRTAEFARIYGIDFFSVLSRGSQFKVESVMFRIAKPESYLLPSPNPGQVATQNAAACIPLIFEPESAFFTSPVLVLDFQSLYPSIMIAYNLCYSTFLGRIDKFNNEYKIGYTKLDLPEGLLTFLQDDITIDPNGNMFVKPHVRMSLLSKMLGEILDTRVMIKASMKGAKGNKPFQRLQHARQLSLKLLANVTYGYTSASFSGRMPCVEIADAIVQFGRRTLEEAIETIKQNPDWGAVTVYGDTDSLFVHLEGKTKEEAFRIGNEIAEVVTSKNPHPVRLKFEKVYLPSVLLAKKRYVGWKFESPEDQVPVFDAKGIETVRRDGFPALQRMVQSVLEILFQTQDLSAVKSYCQRQWRKIYEGRVSIQDFIIAKEVRLGSYKENAVPPPGAAVAARLVQSDHRAEPQHAERVPYIITQGQPKAKMNDRAVTPDEMIRSKKLRLDANYYIVKGIIPPLKRIFNLVGCDVESWFNEMPRISLLSAPATEDIEDIKVKLTDHYRSDHCLICGHKCGQTICIDCRSSPTCSTHRVLSDLHLTESRHEAISRICASCSLFPSHSTTPCISFDCPMTYTKSSVENRMKVLDYVLKELDNSLPKEEILIEDAWK